MTSTFEKSFLEFGDEPEYAPHNKSKDVPATSLLPIATFISQEKTALQKLLEELQPFQEKIEKFMPLVSSLNLIRERLEAFKTFPTEEKFFEILQIATVCLVLSERYQSGDSIRSAETMKEKYKEITGELISHNAILPIDQYRILEKFLQIGMSSEPSLLNKLALVFPT